jgi:transposase InsO family protein
METCAVDERMRFVIEAEKEEESFAQLCRRFGISRRIGYKWFARFTAESIGGLQDRSRAPHNRPHALKEEIAERCAAIRRTHPTWGPVKVRGYLERRAPEIRWPAASTIGELFDREGLTVKRKIRRRTPPAPQPFPPCLAPNDAWSMDFKGWFCTSDGRRCEPLTLQDQYSRYLLRCQVVPRTGTEQVWPILDAAFREFGLPQRLRSDNGSPFASTGAGGLSRLAVKVVKAGVTPERIKPGKPQQNGRLERLHLTLLKDAADPPARTLREQIERFRSYRRLYNEERPHQALNNDVPAQHFAPSLRSWDGILRSPDYGDEDEVRRVRHNGEIRWLGRTVYINQALTREPVGLRPQADGSCIVRYGPVVLGMIEHRGDRLRRIQQPTCGLVGETDRSGSTRQADSSPTSPQVQQKEQG